MVDFSTIKNLFTAAPASAPTPAAARPAAPAGPTAAAPSAPATTDSFSAGGSDPGRTFRSYTDPGTAAGQWLGDKLKPHISDATRQKAQDLGAKVEAFRKRDDLPGHEVAEKIRSGIDTLTEKTDHFLKEHVPGLGRALEPKVIDGGELD